MGSTWGQCDGEEVWREGGKHHVHTFITLGLIDTVTF